MSYGGDTNANALLVSLLFGEDVTIPEIDLDDAIYIVPGDETSSLYSPIVRITNAELTEQTTTGTGTFDVIMGGFRAQLVKEFNEGRISGAEYTKAFIALSESAMSNAVQFLISRDGAFWQAAQAQTQAITARVNLAIAKVQYASLHLEAMNNRANYGLTKLKLATEDVNFAQGKYQLDYLLPAQLGTLLEQKEAQRAQTLNTRSDGTTVAGVLGKQKDLYGQQITSYQRDAEVKAVKLFADFWSVNKTVGDENAAVPAIAAVNDGTGGTTAGSGSLNEILTVIKNNNNL